jgi:putative NIF3 family GTP cyclohydrolase 1 type 2
VSESVMHTSAESGVAFLAAGHHATERFGVQAVGKHLSEQFDIEHLFIDIPNPV